MLALHGSGDDNGFCAETQTPMKKASWTSIPGMADGVFPGRVRCAENDHLAGSGEVAAVSSAPAE